ncbi:MAG: hypothetical protein IJF54_03395 [Clostridia bacterium]|nr:hypothetical protein [Clostridia bacterium]
MANFGEFRNGNEYRIHKTQLARPLLNYIWNARVLSGVNHLGGGNGAYGQRALAYIDQTGKGRCTVIRDGNRYFYIKDKDSKKVFNPGWYPCKTEVENFECIHGLGYSTIQSECDGIFAKARVFVNAEDPCEIWTITLTNNSDKTREISAYSFVDFQLDGYSRYSDANSYLHSEFDEETNTIVCFNGAMERPHEWFNGFFSTNVKPVAFETSKRAFVGVYSSIADPDGVKKDKLTNGFSTCEPMVGAFQHDFTIESGKSVQFSVIIGAVDTMETGKALAKKVFADGKIESDFAALIDSKKGISTDIFVNTPDERINNFANYWLKQQVQLCAEVGRDTGKGFRDQLQDAWAVASFNPQLAKEKILETLTYMYSDGRCVRGWLPLDHHIYSDGPTWITPTINAYIKETGDVDFLNHPVKYLDEGEDTVWEHILTAMRFVSEDLGPHGLVKARDGDWNDSLNMIGLEGKGESVWTSIALHYALKNAAEIAENILKDNDIRDEMLCRAEKIKKAVNEQGWDGEWYLAAINDLGNKVGTHTEKEGMIYLNSQTWAVLSGVADEERKAKCLKAVDTYLDSDYGPLTLYPTYTKFNNKIGRLTSFIPGIWENGTPYCHGGTFKVVADCIEGLGDKAYETISKILPDGKTNPSTETGCEPYVVTNMYFGPDNPRKGETLFAWVTGTAGWMFRAITQYMLGFHPDYDSFTINPCIPAEWNNVTLSRKFRGDVYKLTISNPDGAQSGAKKIIVDGKEIEGNRIAIFGDAKEHTIEVIM